MARKSCTSSPDLLTSFLAAPPKSEVLERFAGLVDWEGLRGVLEGVYKLGGVGREPVDPVMLFKLLLLERLYILSDGDAVWMARDSLSFRSFLGLGAGERVPDDTTLVVFRRPLREAGLFDELFARVTVDLERKGIGVRPGCIKIVDATLVKAAVRPPRRGSGGGGGHRKKDAPADGCLPEVIRGMQERGEDVAPLLADIRGLLRDSGLELGELARALDEREQFVHHYHGHERYLREMRRAGLEVVRGVKIPPPATTVPRGA